MKRTLIKDARNLGSTSAAEMASLGIVYLDQIEKMGWEEFCVLYVEHFPSRLNLNAFTAILGALVDQDWRRLDSDLKLQAQNLLKRIKSGNF